MDDELKQFLIGMQRAHSEDISRLESRLREEMTASEDRLKKYTHEVAEKSETSLLRAFHQWARAMEVRVRHNTSGVYGFDERLSMVEERISDLERDRLK